MKLLPCKTCAPDRYTRYETDGSQIWVRCDGCGATGPACNTTDEAVEFWNIQQEENHGI